MPRILRGEALANAIYQATDKLEEQFAEIFLAEVRKLSRSKALRQLLDEVEAGQLASAGLTSRLNVIGIPTKKLDELVRKAMGSAIRITNEKTGLNLSFDYRNPDVIQAARGMSIDLSTNLSKTAQQILQKTIGDAIEGIITRREAIQIIESRVGLIPAHAEAVERYYERLIAEGRKKSYAKKMADKYADRLLRYRATTIARTEIARATGMGQTEFWKQAIADGLLPPKTKRVWITATDERVCEICGAMDGVQVEINQPWMTRNGLVSYPSAAHPNCRCTQGIALSKDYLKMFRSEISERQEILEELQKNDSLKLDWWLLSKANPYHDELGRFTSADKATGGKGGKPKIKRGSGENRTVKEQLAGGPLNLAFGRDANGMPVVGTAEQIKERYGSTPEQWTAYFKNKYGIEVDFKDTNAFDDEVRTAATFGAIQALDDVLSNLNVLPSGLTTKPPLATIKINNGVKPKGWYMGALNGFVQTHSPTQQDGLPRDSRAFILGVNTQVCADSTRSILEGVQDSIARQEGNMSFSAAEQWAVQQAQSANVSGRMAVVGVSDFYNPDMQTAAARLSYAVMVHEFGHVLDIPELFLPQNGMPAGTSRDLKNTSDSIRRTPWSRTKSVSEYGSFYAHEKMAEGFAAWFLFSQLTGSSKILTSYTTMENPNAKQTYGDIKQLSAKIILPLLENLNPPITSQQIVKQDGNSVTIVSELPSDHPIIVFTLAPFLKNVSKANPYHDELGRFTSADKATGGKGRKPKMKRGGSKLVSGMKKVFKTAQDHGYILNARQQTALSRLSGGEAVTTPPKELRDFFAHTNGELTVSLVDVRVYSKWTDPEKPHGMLGFDMKIKDKNGNEVGEIQYEVKMDEDGKIGRIEHSLMTIEPHAQGTGLGFEYVSRITSQFEAAGAEAIFISAGLSIGGYAWAKQGYQWSSKKTMDSVIAGTKDTLDFLTGHGTDREPAQKIQIQADAEMKLLDFVSDVATEKWVRDGTPSMRKDVEVSVDKAAKQISQPKFQETLKQARKILEQVDADSGKPSPKDIANLGRDAAFTILVPVEKANGKIQLKPLTLWAGKLALLGSGWDGIMPLGGRSLKLDLDEKYYEVVDK